MKKLNLLLLSVVVSFLFQQCQQDEIDYRTLENQLLSGQTITVNEEITSDVTWSSGNTYILNDMIAVSNNATLTIEPCVIVKALDGANGLIIERGSIIDAKGTEDCPIIFTSVQDQIETGEILSPNLTSEDKGLWSGIFILGEAPVSSGSINENIIPLLPTDPIYKFGGSNLADDSGSLKYVSIRHTGFETSPSEAPSGLNLGGVGSETMISHIELFANVDDGLKIIGGNVDANNLVITDFNDDGIDIDRGYAGIIDNIIGVGGSASNSSLELDGGEGLDNPNYTIKNASFKGSQSGEHYIDFQNEVHCLIENCYFFEFDENAEVMLKTDVDADH
jgi:hypothetical protein